MNTKSRTSIGIQIIISIIIGILICGAMAMPVRAEANQTVRVGYYPVSNYQDQSKDGTYSGFSYDYYMQIQKYTRWDYEFVKASYADCVKMLVAGQIDMISGIVKTDARAEQMIFSSASVSNTQNKLYAVSTSDLYYEDYENFNNKKVAILKGSLSDELDSYCAAREFKVNLVEYDTTSKMEEALKNGDVDMVYSGSINTNIDTKIVARLAKIPLYYAVTKSRPDLANQLDVALQSIVDNNPNFYTDMSEKYMINGANVSATYTKEESEYLKSAQTISVIINPDWAPISWYDDDTKSFRGIAVDVMDLIVKNTNLNVEYMTEEEFTKKAAEDSTLLNNVVAILADDNAWALTQNVMLSNHFANSSVVTVAKRSSHQTTLGDDARIALPKDYYISWRVKGEYNDDQITYYDSISQCLDAVNTGRADATYVNELVASYQLSKLEYSNLFTMANTGYHEALGFAVNKDSDKPLLGIINKALLSISTDELDQITVQNTVSDQAVTIRGLYYSNPTAVLLGIVLMVLAVAAVGFVIYNTQMKKQHLNAALEREYETTNARTEFFMMISHELRTPLNAIVGYLELATADCKAQGVNIEYLNRSTVAARQLTSIAEDMLDYTHIASDSATLQSDVVDIKEVIRDVEQIITAQAAKKDIGFRFAVEDISQEFIIGDKLRLAQIMLNILHNGVKFTDNGGDVDAKVLQRTADDGQLELVFVAKDNGKGMTEDFLKTVCTPFKQGDKAYSRTHGGLGLGLYLTKYYLDAMHGHMDVQSTLGEGSTFTITLPLQKASSSQVLDQNIDFSHIRALIIGEDEDCNTNLKVLLKRLKVKSDILNRPEKAVKRIRARLGGDYAYDLCIIDDTVLGDEATLATDILEYFDNPPVLFAMSKDDTRLASLKADDRFDRVLYKPVFQSELFDAIMVIFGQYTVEQSVEQYDFDGMTALIVEDNAVNADILDRVLKKGNVSSVICENGQEAVEAMAQHPLGTYDVVFMDIQMPIMDGYEATRVIRALPEGLGETIPIIAVSANAFPEDIEKSLESGMNAHLSKPISYKSIFQAISTYCTKE